MKKIFALLYITTIIIVAAFIYISIKKNLYLSQINEIGDALGGFAGSLAFLWLVATALMQKHELSLQRKEIEQLNISSKSQALALDISAKIQARDHLESMFKKYESALREINHNANEAMKEFIENLGYRHFEDFNNKLPQAVDCIAGNLVGEHYLDLPNLDANEIELKNIPYTFYLMFQSLDLYLIRSWRIVSSIETFAREYELTEVMDSWLESINIYWHKVYARNISIMHRRLAEHVVEKKQNHKEFKIALNFVEASLNEWIFETPWQTQSTKIIPKK